MASTISITLKAFDKAVNIGLAGSVSSSDTLPVHTTDANATVNIGLTSFKNLFAFYTDYVDVDNSAAADVLHYIDGTVIPSSIGLQGSFDISPALVTLNPVISTNPAGGALTTGDLVVKKDYVRHLSKLLFNTEYGADLFVNEAELVVSVGAALNAALLQCFNDMKLVSTTGTDPKLKGDANHKYLERDYSGTDDNGSRRNICAELFNVLLSTVPSRFVNLSSLEIDETAKDIINPNASKLYRLPFIAGDSIVIKVALKPAVDQDWFGQDTMVVNGSAVDKVDNQRSYKIELVLS
jgi:hypothetical protein